MDDFVLITVDLRAARKKRLAARNRLTGRRSVAGNGDFLLDEGLVAGKIEGVNLEQPGLGIEEREAGVVVVNDALESLDDAAEKFREFSAGDQEIVDFEKNQPRTRSEEHTSELQSRFDIVCRLLLEKKN